MCAAIVRQRETMTVNASVNNGSDLQNKKPRSMSEIDEEAAGMRKKAAFVHNQVMRIREEDSFIGEDIAEGLGLGASYRDKVNSGRLHHVASPVIFSRPILPCSPLSGKATRHQGLALK